MNMSIDWIPVTERVPESFETECLLAIIHRTRLYFAVGRYDKNGGHKKWECDDETLDSLLYYSESEDEHFMTEEEIEDYKDGIQYGGYGPIVKIFGPDERDYYRVIIKEPKCEVVGWISLTELRKKVMSMIQDNSIGEMLNAGAGNNRSSYSKT